jgi:hypothetical protein
MGSCFGLGLCVFVFVCCCSVFFFLLASLRKAGRRRRREEERSMGMVSRFICCMYVCVSLVGCLLVCVAGEGEEEGGNSMGVSIDVGVKRVGAAAVGCFFWKSAAPLACLGSSSQHYGLVDLTLCVCVYVCVCVCR